MNGKQIKDWVEYTVRYYKQVSSPSDPIVKDPALNIADYNLDQLYGASYDIDLTQSAATLDSNGRVVSGNRIKNLKFNGQLVKDSDVFTVAINNYRYNGGGGFMAAAGISNTDLSIVTYDSAKVLGDDGQVRSLMMEYVKDHRTIMPITSNNWKLYTTSIGQSILNNAEIISSNIPKTMDAGKTYTATIAVKNTGSNTWTAANNYNLGAVGDSDPFAAGRIYMDGNESVASGETKTFTITFTAPKVAGTYTTDWQMVQEAVEWFGSSTSTTVIVTPSAVPSSTEVISKAISYNNLVERMCVVDML